jgi:hypothetical protein
VWVHRAEFDLRSPCRNNASEQAPGGRRELNSRQQNGYTGSVTARWR